MRFFLSVFLLIVLATTAFGQNPIEIQAQPCFDGMSAGGTCPVVVTIQNNGRSVDGALSMKSDDFMGSDRKYTYPVSLPAGSEKRLIIYPRLNQYASDSKVEFDGGYRTLAESAAIQFRPFHYNYSEGIRKQIGLISDQTGGLEALKSSASQNGSNGAAIPSNGSTSSTYNDCYALPEDAPDRASGYRSMNAIVLSDGAERMNPAQWSAIRRWVLEGGSLIVLGGASALYTHLPDAQPLLPLTSLHSAVAAHVNFDGSLSLPAGNIALMTGTAKPGATILQQADGNIIASTLRYGAGSVLLVGFNPLDSSFNYWGHKDALWKTLISDAAPTVGTTALVGGVASPEDADRSGGSASDAADVDPFLIQLPPLSTVLDVFILYFVLVIPVNYIVLKRLKRPEYAWATAPIMSIGFAFVFYLLTASLYTAGLSRRTSGVVVAVAGQPEAQFLGNSEVFFPHGGSYDIDIPNAETLDSTDDSESDYGPGGMGRGSSVMETIDNGYEFAPNFQVTNLAFRRIYHSQPVAMAGTVDVDVTESPAGIVSGTVTNRTGLTLSGGMLAFPGFAKSIFVGNLGLGETATVKGDVAFSANGSPRFSHGRESRGLLENIAASTPSHNSVVFLAAMKGDPYGPQLGHYVGKDGSVVLFESAPITTTGSTE